MASPSTKLTSTGNFYINSGQFDEATFNPSSGYAKNLIINSNFVGGTSGDWGVGATNPTGYVGNGNGGGITFAPALSGAGNSIRFYCTIARPYLNQYNYYPIRPGVPYTFSVTIESITTSCGVASLFSATGIPNVSMSYYLNGVLVTGSIYLTQIVTGKYQVVFTAPLYYPSNSILWRIGPGVSGTETADFVLANPQIELGNTATIYEPTNAAGLVVNPTGQATKTTASGFYTTGTLDEASYNPASGYTKNLLTASQTFTSGWSLNSGSLIQNAILAPDNKSFAVKFVEVVTGNAGSNQRIYYKPATIGGVTYTYSVYLKAAERYIVRIYFEDSSSTPAGGRVGQILNLQTGTIASTYYSTGINTLLGSTLQPLPNGWYRYSWTVKALVSSAVNTNAYVIIGTGNTPSNFAYDGNGVSGMYWFGPQMEVGSVATDYVPTSTSSLIPNPPKGLVQKTTGAGNNYIAGEYDEVSYNPASGVKKNLIYNSVQVIPNTNWRAADSFLLPNSAPAPDGTRSATTWFENTSALGRYAETFYGAAGGMIGGFSMNKPYTWSLYVKANGRTQAILQIYDILPSSNMYAIYNLTTGQITGSAAATNSTYLSSTITPVVNGWYRISVTGIPNRTGTTSTFYSVRVLSSFANFQGDGISGLLLWAPQLEIGTAPTTYVATTATGAPLT